MSAGGLGDIGSVLQMIGGRAVDALGIASSIEHGNLGSYLANQAAAAQDPAYRAQLQDSPFRAGMLGYGLQRAPEGQLGPGVAGPQPANAIPGAQPGQLVANLPPLGPEAQFTQAEEQFKTQLYQRAQQGDPAALQALHMGGPQGKVLRPGQEVVSHAGHDWITLPDGSLQLIGATPHPAGGVGGGGAPGYGEELVPEPPPPAMAPPPAPAQPPSGIVQNRAPEPREGAMIVPEVPPTAPQAAPQAAPDASPGVTPGVVPPDMVRMFIRPGTHVAHTPTGDVYSAPTGFSVKGTPEMKVYDPTQPPKAAPVSPNLMRSYAAGIDPSTGRPASPEQRQQGRAYEDELVREKRKQSEAASGARPMTQGTQETLATIASVSGAAKDLRKMLDDPNVTRWLGPGPGNASWFAYQTLGVVPNEAVGHFITINELFKIESAGRLARLAGSRARAVWQELTIHPPHPGDSISLIKSKLNDIDYVTKEIGKTASKLAGMPRDKAAAFMDKQLQGDTPAPGGGGTPTLTPGQAVPGMPGVIYEGPAN